MGYNELNTIIWVMFLGVSFGAVYAFYNKKILGDFVRKLISDDCYSPESAKTLKQLGYKSAPMLFIIKSALKNGSSLRRFVKLNSDDENKNNDDDLFSNKKKTGDTAFYLPSELTEKAQHRYDNRGSTLTAVIMTIITFFIVAVLSIYIIPFLSNFAKGVFGGGRDTSNDGYTEPEQNKVTTVLPSDKVQGGGQAQE